MLCCLLAQGKKINLENLNFKENGEQLRLLLGHEFFPHLPTRELFLNHFRICIFMFKSFHSLPVVLSCLALHFIFIFSSSQKNKIVEAWEEALFFLHERFI